MSNKEVNLSGEERVVKLQEQLKDVMGKREELTSELNALTTVAVKLQGAIEVLESINDETKEEKE